MMSNPTKNTGANVPSAKNHSPRNRTAPLVPTKIKVMVRRFSLSLKSTLCEDVASCLTFYYYFFILVLCMVGALLGAFDDLHVGHVVW